jgi:cytochrome c oxidase subunit II
MDWFWELVNLRNWMGLPDLAAEHGKQVDFFIYYIHWLMAVLFFGWVAYFFYALWRFRKGRSPKADHVGLTGTTPKWVEGGVILAEIILLFFLAIPLWAKRADEKHFPKGEATVLRVTAQQFAWNSRYPGKDGEFGRQDLKLITGQNPLGFDPEDPKSKDDFDSPVNDIWVPINKPVIMHLTSMDVIHSFAVKNLRMCQDAIPGMSVPIHFVPTRAGKYRITCAQLCGNSHYAMRALFTVANPKDYDAWVVERSASAGGAGAAAFE